MKMKKALLVLCVLALAVGSVFGTLAYLTDADSNTNTFTVGSVQIKLDEADVNEDGTLASEDRVIENTYHLLPGHTYIKDPTIHVSDDSEGCYLFVKVENGIAAIETKEAGKTIAEQMKALNWVPVDGVPNVYVLAKGEADKHAVFYGAEVVVFNNFTIDGGSVDNDTLKAYEGKTVVVTAYAVQMDGFEDHTPEQIWDTVFSGAANP